jgi:hypothetical protein
MNSKPPKPLIAGMLAAFGAGLITLFYLKKRSTLTAGKPPRNAPQLDLHNPGSQDEFPTAPGASEIG